jgi:Tol biopolymer transport system component/DNA-binding winged helix-turn-helix (wHTH) protein
MNEIYKFGPFRVDFALRQLSHREQPVSLTPKVFQTLEILLRNRDRIVSKRELLATIWPESYVEEANLTQNVSVLRKALGETSSGTKLIATFPKQGYRFIGSVEEEPVRAEEARETFLPLPRGRRKLPYTWVAALLLPMAVLGVSRLLPTRPRLPDLGGQRTVTHLPGRAFQPAISPDGKLVAFVWRRDLDSALRIGVIRTAEPDKPQILDTGDGDAFSPAWSPDGRRLAYLHSIGTRVAVALQQTSRPPQELADLTPGSYGIVARQLDWSPDGRFLAVSVKSATDEPFRIELIHIAEKRRTVLTTPPELSDGDFQPRFSPDGSKLAFVRQRSIGESEALYVPIPGGDPVAIGDSRDPIGDIDWTPDSHSAIFTPDRAGKSEVIEAPLSPRASASRRGPVGELASGMIQFAVSRATGQMALARADANENIWRAELDDEHSIAGWERLIVSAGENAYPAYSPDGKKIAFVSDRTGGDQLWVRESDGRERQLTFGNLKPGAPSWTGDSDTLVFPALRKRTLYRFRLDSAALESLRVGEVGAHTAVSPDGTWVYLVRRFLIMRAPSAGGAPTPLTDQGGFPLRLSGDGNWIYYVRHRYSSEIWRVRRADGFIERLTKPVVARLLGVLVGQWRFAGLCSAKRERGRAPGTAGPRDARGAGLGWIARPAAAAARRNACAFA